MKRTILLASVLLFSTLLKAQSFEVYGLLDNHKGYIGDLIKAKVELKNTTTKSITLVIRKIDAQIGSTQKNFLCPDGFCLDVSLDDYTLKLEPGQSLQNFAVGLEAGLVPVSSHIKYLIYNKSNPNDALEIELNFSVEEKPAKNNIYSSRFINIHDVYPNPVSDYAHINYHLLNEQVKAKIIIHNILGNAIAEYELPLFETQVKIRTEEFTSGIYFYTLYLDNEGVMTRKLVVRR